jgi:hypothetical protein
VELAPAPAGAELSGDGYHGFHDARLRRFIASPVATFGRPTGATDAGPHSVDFAAGKDAGPGVVILLEWARVGDWQDLAAGQRYSAVLPRHAAPDFPLSFLARVHYPNGLS